MIICLSGLEQGLCVITRRCGQEATVNFTETTEFTICPNCKSFTAIKTSANT